MHPALAGAAHEGLPERHLVSLPLQWRSAAGGDHELGRGGLPVHHRVGELLRALGAPDAGRRPPLPGVRWSGHGESSGGHRRRGHRQL